MRVFELTVEGVMERMKISSCDSVDSLRLPFIKHIMATTAQEDYTRLLAQGKWEKKPVVESV